VNGFGCCLAVVLAAGYSLQLFLKAWLFEVDSSGRGFRRLM